ncbi:MAG: DUF6067 family protein, partial [Planctomycetota bacterium]|nr:DUF6067 family protein [Planctomycetota bacterium]
MKAIWRVWSVAITAIFLLCFEPAPGGEEAGVRAGYKAPLLTVPYAHAKPAIDGVVDDAEWQAGLSINALQTVNKTVSSRQTRWWVLWDEDNLYFAMRSPLREGERVIQALRNRERDINVVFDDSYEIWLDMNTIDPKTGLVAFFQFLSNFDATRLDVVHQPSVGNSSIAWTAGWQPKNRITPDGKAWEMEVAVPRASIYKNEPLADGLRFRCLLARNYKRPWEQNSIEGCSCFTSVEAWSRFVLSKTAPGIHLLAVADPAAQTFGVRLAAFGQQEGKILWAFAADSGAKKEGEIALQKGALAPGPSELDLEKPGEGGYRIQVLAADGKTMLLDWAAKRAFGDLKALAQKIEDKGDQVSLSLEFNPVRSYVRVTGDFINYDNRAAIDRCDIAVLDAAGKALGELALKIDANAYVKGVLKLPALAVGEYKTRLVCRAKDGKEILAREEKFAKKDEAKEFPWWKTQVGNIERVIDPWTPMTLKADEIGVWGRTLKVGAAGLPAQVISQGQPLLASPCRLELVLADGKTLAATAAGVKPQSQAEHRVVMAAAGAIGDLQVKSVVTAEFDGMYKIDLTLAPAEPIEIKALRVVVPLRNEVAEYLHAAGEGIRTGFDYAFISADKKGRLWDCRKVDSQPMLVGSFIPYLWIGCTKGGLAWFADSDEGWIPNDQEPAIEIRRDSAESTDLILNLVSAPATLDKERTIVFAFQATPVKPLAKGWRMDSWWCGDTFRDYSCSGDIIWTARPFTMDKEKCKAMVESQHKGSNDFIFGAGTGSRANAVPYFIHQSLPAHLIPEVRYFGDEWRTSISECLFYGDTLTDYMIWNLYNWA